MRVILLSLLLLSFAVPASAEGNLCPCIPETHQWTVTACDTWNCAQSAAILANGDPFVLAIPTASADHHWIVLRRIASGTGTVTPDGPFVVDSFHSLSDATARFSTIDNDQLPMLISTADGDMLVVRLRVPEKRRSASH